MVDEDIDPEALYNVIEKLKDLEKALDKLKSKNED